jgi:molybdate/tungstate transport system substrate-binding protein
MQGEHGPKRVIFHAGSLSVPFKEIAEAFNKEYPAVNILLEPAGSVASARKITDLDRPCDILASSDYKVIDNMLIPKYASWNIRFASNEMVIVYTSKSKYLETIDSSNWYKLLLQNDVFYGRADPNQDPCGYRTVLTLKLAEKYYGSPDLAKNFINKDVNYMRPKEVDLLALLETNSVDYIFIYRSVAEQHKMEYVRLPDEINLENPALAEHYSGVSVDIVGDTPDTRKTIKGEPMIYSMTILNNAPNKEAAMSFATFLLNPNKGMAIMIKNGQPSVIPSTATGYDQLPASLKKYATK